MPDARSAWPIWRLLARTAPTGWPRFIPNCCARRRSRTWPRSSLSDSTTRPTELRRGAGCCCQLRRLKPLADDAGFRSAVHKAKREAKLQFVDWLKSTSGISVDPDTIFDSQIKRIHEYKRQLLNALRIVVYYNRLRQNPNLDVAPRTFLFSGKAAPAYQLAKLIIKFINNLAGTIDGDPAVRGRLKVVFLPEYSASLAE